MNKKTYSFLSVSLHPRGLLTAAGYVACLATLFGFLGRFSWFLDLFSHFRVQYLLGLSIIGTLLFVSRNIKTAAVLFVFASINFGFVLPMYLGGLLPPVKNGPTYFRFLDPPLKLKKRNPLKQFDKIIIAVLQNRLRKPEIEKARFYENDAKTY